MPSETHVVSSYADEHPSVMPELAYPIYGDENGNTTLPDDADYIRGMPGKGIERKDYKPRQFFPTGGYQKLGPWKRIDGTNEDRVLYLGPRERNEAAYFTTIIGNNRDDKIARFLRWFISDKKDPPPDLNCQRISNYWAQQFVPAPPPELTAFYCLKSEGREIITLIRNRVVEILKEICIPESNIENVKAVIRWLGCAVLEDKDLYLIIAACEIIQDNDIAGVYFKNMPGSDEEKHARVDQMKRWLQEAR